MARIRRLVGEKCYLSPPCVEDAEVWTAWLCDPDVAIPLGDEAYGVYSVEKMREEIGGIISGQEPVFTIVDLVTDEPVGRGLLFGVNAVDRTAQLGLFIGKKELWDQGYGTEAVRLLLDYGFSLLNLHAVMLGTFAFNRRAQRCYEKIGFRVIGRRRQARLLGGERHDAILMDILASEFESPYVQRHLPKDEIES